CSSSLSLSIRFVFSCYGDLLDLHSFPTRRSSDLCASSRSPSTVGSSAALTDAFESAIASAGKEAIRRARRSTKGPSSAAGSARRSEEQTSELQSRGHLVCRLLPEKKKSDRNRDSE